jgi:hypothetical protein
MDDGPRFALKHPESFLEEFRPSLSSHRRRGFWCFLVIANMRGDGSASPPQRICTEVLLTLTTPAQWLDKARFTLALGLVVTPAFWAFLPSALLAGLWHRRKSSVAPAHPEKVNDA